MKDAISKRPSALPVVTLLILALLAVAPLWGPGIVNTRAGGDSPFLLWRTHQMAVSLRAGVFPVRWMPDAAYGYGYPFFSYMAALPYYVAAVLNIIGLDILTAIKLTQTLGFVAAAFAMYGWMRRHLARAGAWVAGVAYTFSAYHLVNVYTRGDSLSEFYAFVFYPLALWAIDQVFHRRSACSAVTLALTYAGLILTHNVSALIFTPFVLLYILVKAAYLNTLPSSLLAPRSSLFAPRSSLFAPRSSLLAPPSTLHTLLPGLLLCAAGLGLGLALAAWFWVPALGETSYAQLGEQTTGYLHYSNHFRSVDLIQPTLAFDYNVGKTTPFAMSAIQAALTAVGLVAIVVSALRRRRLEALPAFTLAGLFVSTAMVTPLSRPLWDHLPLLPLVQFPWRFLSVQTMFTALATAQVAGCKMRDARGATHNTEYGIRNTQYPALALSLLLVLSALANLHPTRLYIGPGDVTTERLQLYEMFTANIGTTIRYEYMPRQVIPRLYVSDALIGPDQAMHAAALEGNAEALRLEAAPTRHVWRAQADAPGATIAFPLLWWPGWQASVDGKPAQIRPADSSGRIVLDLTPGEHTVVLILGRTPLRALAESFSLVTAIAVLIIAAVSLRHVRIRLDKETAGNLGVLGISAVIFLAALVIFFLRSTPVATAQDETMDFSSQPYLHHNPGGVEMLSGLRLVSYDLSVQDLQPGQTLNVSLQWANVGHPQTVTVQLVSPAQHLVGLESAPTLAQSVAPVPTSATARTMHALTIPPETARGIYLLKVLAGPEPVYLRPVRIQNPASDDNLAVQAMFGDRIRLHRVLAEQVTPTQLSITLYWSAARPVEANYAVAVRLRGVASVDTQPGYGFLPTSLWHPGEMVTDRYTLWLPEGTPPASQYEAEVILYDAETLAGIGQYIQGDIALTLYALRPADSPTLARFGPELALAKLEAPARHEQGAPTLPITAGWLATASQSADRSARWTVYDSAGAPVFTQTVDLAAETSPSTWPVGAFVVGQSRLNLPSGLAPGHYRLGVTVVNAATGSVEGSYVAPDTFEITGHPRSFVVPPMQRRTDTEFGQQLKLLGYDLESPARSADRQRVALTLYWQAIVAPQADYTLFVHLARPADDKIVAQYDAMPFGGRYPTSWWAAGEVVSETVTLDLVGVQPGAYRLAIGVYDARTTIRLAATSPDGARLDADRLVLPETVTRP